MEKSYLYIILGIVIFVLSNFTITRILRLLLKINQVDKPDNRKKHSKITATSGGILFIIQALIMIFFFYTNLPILMTFICGSILGFIGFLDDRFDLSPKIKLVFQLILTLPIIFIVGTIPFSLWMFDNQLIYIDLSLTLLALIAFVNAINLIDGMDGFLGSIVLYSFAYLGMNSWLNGLNDWTIIMGTFVIGLICFLRLNFNPAKLFMGDTGSLFLGVILGSTVINSVNQPMNEPSTNAAIIGLVLFPLLDEVRVFIDRVLRKKSPFVADRIHFHHLLLNLGLKPFAIIIVGLTLTFSLQITGLFFSSFDFTIFQTAVIQSMLYFVFMSGLYLIDYKRKIKGIEALENILKKIKTKTGALKNAA